MNFKNYAVYVRNLNHINNMKLKRDNEQKNVKKNSKPNGLILRKINNHNPRNV